MQPRGRLPTHGYRDGVLVDEDDGRKAVGAVLCSSLHTTPHSDPSLWQGRIPDLVGGRICSKLPVVNEGADQECG
jgi:hypothetical protein